MTNPINGFRSLGVNATTRTASAAGAAAGAAANAPATTGKLAGDTLVAGASKVGAVSGNAAKAVEQAEKRLAAAFLFAQSKA